MSDRLHHQEHVTDTQDGLSLNVRSTSGGNLFIFDVPYSQLTHYLEFSSSRPFPAVLTAPIRLDVVQQVHSASNP